MATQQAVCRYCNGIDVVCAGWQSGAQRYRCKPCNKTFKTDCIYRARKPGVKAQVVEMALNGSGIRDTGRVLGIGQGEAVATLKKASEILAINPYVGSRHLAI